VSTRQFIRHHGKPAFVVIPIAEWRRIDAQLALDRVDAASVRAFLAHPTETFPDTVTAALIDGVHPLRVFRVYRGLTQAKLAAAAGTSPVYISQIERRRRQAGRKLTIKLAKALQVDRDLLEPRQP
jgi:DNA-binding XRE family transcriptional regulator